MTETNPTNPTNNESRNMTIKIKTTCGKTLTKPNCKEMSDASKKYYREGLMGSTIGTKVTPHDPENEFVVVSEVNFE